MNNLIPYRKQDKWGYCNNDKIIVIECIYDEAEPFKEGFAIVRIANKYGFIMKKVNK